MNHRSSVLIREADGQALPKKQKKRKDRTKNTLLCPACDFIGRHVPDEEGNCRNCNQSLTNGRANGTS